MAALAGIAFQNHEVRFHDLKFNANALQQFFSIRDIESQVVKRRS